MGMPSNVDLGLAPFHILERTRAGLPGLADLNAEIGHELTRLALPPAKLAGRRIAVTVGSRGVARVAEITRAICAWLKDQGAMPFVFPAMGSHGGATAEGQRKILEDYGVTADFVGAEIRSSMETVSLGRTPEGYEVFMDRNAFESDGVVVMNRVKPHTAFAGRVESGLSKMMAVGMGKIEAAAEFHRHACRAGYEPVVRAMAGRALASAKILCGVAVVENEFHEMAAVRAALPETLVAREEEALALSKTLVPRLPFPRIQMLIVDELGKNISGSGMDTKVIGRGVALAPDEAPKIQLIYARGLTPESGGNALGVGLADLIHERLYRAIDLKKMYLNAVTSMNPMMVRLPIHLPSDREALHYAIGILGSPRSEEQRIVWIRNTLAMNRIRVTSALAAEARAAKSGALAGWQGAPEQLAARLDTEGNLVPG
jgi:lactate racemase-like protein